jgi:MFS family permease
VHTTNKGWFGLSTFAAMFKRYSKDFWLLSASMFFFMLSFNLILPELNGFISQLGGAKFKGSIIFLFAIAAGLSRPFAGKLADLIGRKRTIYVGIAIALVTSLCYPIMSLLGFFMLLRFVHGLSAGFAPTGSTALLTDILPAGKKGAAMGLWGTFISLGIGIGQALGSSIFSVSNFDILFLCSAAFAVIALLFIFPIKETLAIQQRFSWQQLYIKKEDVLEPDVKPAAFIMLLTAISSGVIFVLSSDFAGYLGIQNKGYFFGIYVLSTIAIRLLFSSISDRIGRRKTMLFGCSLLAVGMIWIGLANSVASYTAGAIIFGLATGISSPTLFAWTADLSPIHRRGTGAGTLFIALEVGIMLGAALTLLVYKNTLETARACFFISAAFALLAVIALGIQLRNIKRVRPSEAGV